MKRCILPIACVIHAYAGSPALPREVSAAWVKFQAALKADDLPALIAMTKFPLRCNEFGGDIKNPKVFAQRYTTIFPAPTKRCFASAPLHPEKWKNKLHYEVWCDVGEYPIRFVFDQVGSQLVLTSIDNVNE